MAYNCKVLDYPKGQHVTIFERPIQEKKKMSKYFTKSYQNQNRTEQQKKHSDGQSLNRTKNKIYNIARSNDWDYFITLTFDRQQVNSDNYEEVTKKLTKFMNNIRTNYCHELKYLIVPELHADGIHYHFHGLLANAQGLRFVDSGKRTNKNQTIFNMPQWAFGFTTATRVEDTQKVSGYITKYITKEMEIKLKNKKRYLRSRNCEVTEAFKCYVDRENFLDEQHERMTHISSSNVNSIGQTVTYVELDGHEQIKTTIEVLYEETFGTSFNEAIKKEMQGGCTYEVAYKKIKHELETISTRSEFVLDKYGFIKGENSKYNVPKGW